MINEGEQVPNASKAVTQIMYTAGAGDDRSPELDDRRVLLPLQITRCLATAQVLGNRFARVS
jgi:hypothetical protein